MLLAATIALDASLYLYKKQNLLTFSWKFEGEINIGAILTFVLLFSFMMTFVSGLIIVGLKWIWVFLLPYKLTSLIDHNRDFKYFDHGYVLDHELEKHALSENNSFMLDLVRKHRERRDKISANTRNIAQLAISVIVLIVLDWSISQGNPGTLVHVVLHYADTHFLVELLFFVFGLFLIIAVKEELAHDHGESWVLYPPLARKD